MFPRLELYLYIGGSSSAHVFKAWAIGGSSSAHTTDELAQMSCTGCGAFVVMLPEEASVPGICIRIYMCVCTPPDYYTTIIYDTNNARSRETRLSYCCLYGYEYVVVYSTSMIDLSRCPEILGVVCRRRGRITSLYYNKMIWRLLLAVLGTNY